VKKEVLDHGYVELVEHWGSDERIIEAARMSTQKGFKGWGTSESPGDEKLLKYLWDNAHATPFEMAGFIVEVKAPIFVFREWHRHRTQSFNEMSARYIPLPNENYIPTVERVTLTDAKNKQAQSIKPLLPDSAEIWLSNLGNIYSILESTYQAGLACGVPKEIARLVLPVGRYSAMRASANLRNWLGFLKLRCDPSAQWEIRQYANAVAEIVQQKFPRVYEVAKEATGMP
jgi:thymidylate synthase (FAD)